MRIVQGTAEAQRAQSNKKRIERENVRLELVENSLKVIASDPRELGNLIWHLQEIASSLSVLAMTSQKISLLKTCNLQSVTRFWD